MIRKITAILMATIFAGMAFSTASVAGNNAAKLNKNFKHLAEYQKTIEDIAEQKDTSVAYLLSILEEAQPTGDIALKRHKWMVKVTAMNLLGEIKNPAALKILKTMIRKSDNVSAIYNSARTIGNIGGKRAFQILRRTLAIANKKTCTYPAIRKKAAILGLGLCGNTKAVPLLKAELGNKNNDKLTLIYTAGSLGMLGAKDGYKTALDSMNAADGKIRSSAIKALGLIGNPDALERLNRVELETNNTIPRRSAKVAIAMIESRQLNDDDKVNYLENKLYNNPRMTEMVRWGTAKLKKMNTIKSRRTLSKMGSYEAPGYSNLRHAAALKFKTMK